jgi:hypothetical protein
MDKMSELDISAIELSAKRIAEEPDIWKRINEGEYRIIFATEEVILDKKGSFSKEVLSRKSSNFLERLALIAIDECHCLWHWQSFRRMYAYLGNIRNSIRRVPWVCLSATLTAHSMAYVHEVCNLGRPTYRISLPLRRDNINIIIAPTPSSSNISPLYDLLRGFNDPSKFPKTVIYIDNVDACNDVTTLLSLRLPANFDRSIFIRPYFGDFDEETKTEIVQSFKEGRTRIVVATDAFGLGVDIPDIIRVIQWQITERIDAAALSQRIGRCVRDRTLQGIAIVYVSEAILDAVKRGTWEEAWQHETPFRKDDSESILCEERPEDQLLVAISKQRRMNCFGIPITFENMDRLKSFTRRLYKPAASLKEAHRIAVNEAKGTRRSPLTIAQKIDPDLMLFLATEGCKHRALGWIFGDPEIWNNSHKYWCCGSCIINKGNNLNDFGTAGISAGLNQWNPEPPSLSLGTTEEVSPMHLLQKRPGRITKAAKSFLLEQLRYSRDILWEAKNLPSTFPEVVIPDKVLGMIVRRIAWIVCKEQLEWEFMRAGWDIKRTLLTSRDVDGLFLVIDSTMSQTWPAEPSRARVHPEMAKSHCSVKRIIAPQPLTVPSPSLACGTQQDSPAWFAPSVITALSPEMDPPASLRVILSLPNSRQSSLEIHPPSIPPPVGSGMEAHDENRENRHPTVMNQRSVPIIRKRKLISADSNGDAREPRVNREILRMIDVTNASREGQGKRRIVKSAKLKD